MADTNRKLSRKVPAVTLSGEIADTVFEALHHDRYKAKIKEIIVEHTDSVIFMKKVQGYAGEEFDRRVYKSVKFWAIILIGWVATAVVTYFATKAAIK